MSHTRLAARNRRTEYYPRFSAEEYDRRREALRRLMADRGLDAVLVYSTGGMAGWPMGYLANYRPPFPTYLALFADPVEPSTLFVGISNHLQYVREVAAVDELGLLLPDPPATVATRLEAADLDRGRVGVISGDPRYNLSLPHAHRRHLEGSHGVELVDVTPAFVRQASVLGAEERALMVAAGAVLDRAVEAFEDAIAVGRTERDLADALREGAAAAGGTVATEFLSSAPMSGAEPGEPLPWKQPSSRALCRGDVVTTELTAGRRGYHAQCHRPYAVGSPPTETYRDLVSVARDCYDRRIEAIRPGCTAADLHAATAPIEESEYGIYDVVCHGYGGGYRHPFIGVEGSTYWPGAEDPLTAGWTFEPGMAVVLQPNVVTPDETAGLQLGATVLLDEDGPTVVGPPPEAFGRVGPG